MADRGANAAAGPRLLYGAVQAAVAVAWSFVAMAGVAALGLWLAGVGKYASLSAVTAAVVAMATGGQVSPSGDLQVFGLTAAGAQGAIDVIPLGVTVVGALVLGWFFVRPLRRHAVLEPAVLVVRGFAAVVAFLVVLALLAWAGNGTVAVNLGSATGGGTGGGSGGSSGSGGGVGGLLGGLGDLGNLGGTIAGITGAKPTVGFKVDLGATLGGGLVWVIAVLALALLVSRRTPLPPGWGALQQVVRPAASAAAAVLLGAVAAGAVAGIVDGLAGKGGRAAVGGVLLGTPNGVFLGVPLGMGVPLNGKASGLLTHFLPKPVDQVLKGGNGQTLTVGGLARLDGRVWLLVVAVALMLLAMGVLAAVRTPRVGTARGRAAEAGMAGLRLGVVLAVALPSVLALAGVSVNANVSVFGFDAAGAGLSLSGNLLLAVVLGFVEGAVAGAVGALLVFRLANDKRPVLRTPRLTEGRPPGSSYAGLPLPPEFPRGTPPEDNPYRR